MQTGSLAVCIYSYISFIFGTDLFYLDIIGRHRRHNNDYSYGFKFVIINSHILERIICDPVIVFVVKIPLHFLLWTLSFCSSELCETWALLLERFHMRCQSRMRLLLVLCLNRDDVAVPQLENWEIFVCAYDEKGKFFILLQSSGFDFVRIKQPIFFF